VRENYPEYFNDALRLGSTANGVFGAKIMWGHVSDFLCLATGDGSTSSGRRINSCLQTLFKGLRYIHMVRRDKLHRMLDPLQPQHHAGITDPRRLGTLLRSVRKYRGIPYIGYGLQVLPCCLSARVS
jgi:hypothetical protein